MTEKHCALNGSLFIDVYEVIAEMGTNTAYSTDLIGFLI